MRTELLYIYKNKRSTHYYRPASLFNGPDYSIRHHPTAPAEAWSVRAIDKFGCYVDGRRHNPAGPALLLSVGTSWILQSKFLLRTYTY